jgi:hypothetical protein
MRSFSLGVARPVVHHRTGPKGIEQAMLLDEIANVLIVAQAERQHVYRAGKRRQIVVPLEGGAAQGVIGLWPPGPGVKEKARLHDRQGHRAALVAEPEEPDPLIADVGHSPIPRTSCCDTSQSLSAFSVSRA